MNILITAGGMTEKIDPVRKITNTATGKIGSLIADEFVKQSGNRVETIFYICEKGTILPQLDCVEVVSVEGVNEVRDALSGLLSTRKIDAVIHSMAVSDYRVKSLTTTENLAKYIAGKLFLLDRHNFENEDALAEYIDDCIINNNCLLDNN